MIRAPHSSSFFFFNDTATTEIYTLSLHDALPIFGPNNINVTWNPSTGAGLQYEIVRASSANPSYVTIGTTSSTNLDRKSTRLNSSHSQISYAVFCLKKKTTTPHACTSNIHHHSSR